MTLALLVALAVSASANALDRPIDPPATPDASIAPLTETSQPASGHVTASGIDFSLLGPPKQEGPVVVKAHFALHEVNEIHDESETFEFAGVLTTEWHDPRQAFDPAVEGLDEKFYTGQFQFNEVSPSWYPQIVMVNEGGMYEKNGVLLRVRPDGTSTLIETVNAIAEADFDMRRFPFDEQRLEAIFEVLGFDRDEVLLRVEADSSEVSTDDVSLPQWTIGHITLREEPRRSMYGNDRRESSALVLRVDVERRSWYERRLVVFPLVVIVLLSFSVFWMDRSSLGDRLSVSFIGILTAVTYQLVTYDHIPRISYGTVMHAFLSWSFIIMCATVLVSLVVGAFDKRGKNALGDRIDQRCRWMFPLGYFGPLLTMLATMFWL